jgi:hypothetical protein
VINQQRFDWIEKNNHHLGLTTAAREIILVGKSPGRVCLQTVEIEQRQVTMFLIKFKVHIQKD